MTSQKLALLVLICYILEYLLPYFHRIVYPKCLGSWIQRIVKLNELSSVMSVRRHGFHNSFMT